MARIATNWSRRLATALIACPIAFACGGGGGSPAAVPSVTVPVPERTATSKQQLEESMLSIIEVALTTRGKTVDGAARSRLRTAAQAAIGTLERDARGRDASLAAGMLDQKATDDGTNAARSLASALIQRATGSAVSVETIDATLKAGSGGACPIYPFC